MGNIPGPKWLDGRTGDGSIGLAPQTTGIYTGTRWKPHDIGGGFFHFECLGKTPGPKWLDGRTGDRTVGLAPEVTGIYTGTQWKTGM